MAKHKSGKLVFDVLGVLERDDAWRVLVISADATLVDLYLALLGAFDWAGDYGAAERT